MILLHRVIVAHLNHALLAPLQSDCSSRYGSAYEVLTHAAAVPNFHCASSVPTGLPG